MGSENTFYLFARPSFIEGMGRVFDFGGVFDVYNVSSTSEEADVQALHTDWIAVGNDLRSAFHQYARQYSGTIK